MLQLEIPGWKRLALEYLVLDFNGTLACDGRLLPGVATRLARLAERLEVHVVTADTFGDVRTQLGEVPCRLQVLDCGDQAGQKAALVETLGADAVAAVGNGRNDRRMLQVAGLGIAVVQREGCAVEALMGADVAAPDILSALELLLEPLRLTATLRS